MKESEIESLAKEIAQRPVDLEIVPQSLLDLEDRERSSLFPWRGQFSPGLIETMLTVFAKADDVILDPFVGSGTTLFEATRKHMLCYGVEINPAAGEMAKTASFANIQHHERNQYFEEAYDLIEECLGIYLHPLLHHPRDVECEKPWEQSLKELMRQAVRSPLVENIILNTMLRYYLSQKQDHPSNFLQGFDKHKAVVEQLPYSEKPCKFFLCDARSIPLSDETVDFIITSPPYINVFNYHQNSRKVMESLGWDMLIVARSEIGSNRRNRGNRFLTVIEYAIDMLQALLEMRRLMREGGRVIIVIGRESRVCGIPFHNGLLIAILALGGAEFDLALRQERKYLNRFGQLIYEDILHFVPSKEKAHLGATFGLDVGKYFLRKALDNPLSVGNIRNEIISAIENPSDLAAPIFEPHKATSYTMKGENHGKHRIKATFRKT